MSPPVAPNASIYHGGIGITVLDNFISEEEKTDALSLFEEMEESTVCSEDGEGETIEARTGYRRWVDHSKTESFHNICKRIASFVGMDLSHAERAQLLYYGEGQKYEPHYDAFDQSSEQWQHYNQGGQRIYTALVYLNDVPEDGGGETAFPVLGYSVRPRAKRMLVFSNVGEDKSNAHPDSLHGAMPVVSGEKKCFTLWFRENPLNES